MSSSYSPLQTLWPCPCTRKVPVLIAYNVLCVFQGRASAILGARRSTGRMLGLHTAKGPRSSLAPDCLWLPPDPEHGRSAHEVGLCRSHYERGATGHSGNRQSSCVWMRQGWLVPVGQRIACLFFLKRWASFLLLGKSTWLSRKRFNKRVMSRRNGRPGKLSALSPWNLDTVRGFKFRVWQIWKFI